MVGLIEYFNKKKIVDPSDLLRDEESDFTQAEGTSLLHISFAVKHDLASLMLKRRTRRRNCDVLHLYMRARARISRAARARAAGGNFVPKLIRFTLLGTR